MVRRTALRHPGCRSRQGGDGDRVRADARRGCATRRGPLTAKAVWRCDVAAAGGLQRDAGAASRALQAVAVAPAPWIGLLRDVALGAIVHIAATLRNLVAAGSSDGVERDALRRARRLLRR